MATTSVAKEAPEETRPRRRGECAGCGSNDKALTAPRPNAGRGYRGEMYCMGCNPRFIGSAGFHNTHYTCLEKLVG